MRCAKLLFLLVFFLLAGCLKGVKGDSRPAHFLTIYEAYIFDVQANRLAENIYEHFSQEFVDGFKKQHQLSTLSSHDLGWLVFSTYMPKESLGNLYARLINDGIACVTLTGKSHDGLPMHVNFEFSRAAGEHWKINRFRGYSFGEDMQPDLPDVAVCPDTSDL